MPASGLRADHLGSNDAAVSPVFILGCSWRCGSTLLQRLLCTVDGLLVWGENQGISALLQEAHRRLRARETVAARERQRFHDSGSSTWIANMGPPLEGIGQLTRRWFLDLYVPATHEAGRRRWGFKEVQHDAAVADFLTSIFPKARVILLVRNPIDVLASMCSRSWYRTDGGGAEGVMRLWCHNVTTFLEARDRYPLVRYEDLLQKPAETVARLEEAIDVPPGAIDAEVLNVRLRGPESRQPVLGVREILALRKSSVTHLSRALGYDVPADPRVGVGKLASALRHGRPTVGRVPTVPNPRSK